MSPLNLTKLHDQLRTPEMQVDFLQKHGILHKSSKCVWLCRREGWEVGLGVGGQGVVEGNRGWVGLSDLHIFVLP